jgi:hypothetical protein
VDIITLYSVPDPDLNPVDPLLIGLLDPDPYYFIKVSKIFQKNFIVLENVMIYYGTIPINLTRQHMFFN